MGLSKYFLLGRLNKGATTYKDYTPVSTAPPRPRAGTIRTWMDNLGILNLLASTGPCVKAIFGIQSDYDDAIAKKHANTQDHSHANKNALDAVSGNNTGDQDLSKYTKGVQGAQSEGSHAGNARGANATDFQFAREAVDRVASGAGSFIGGGQHNKVSGANSMAAAGSHNEVSGQFCLVSGEHNEVTADHCMSAGDLHEVSGNKSAAFGSGHIISAESGFAEGDGNVISGFCGHAEGSLNECVGDYSHAEGMNARAYNNFQHAKASGGFANPGEIGEAQYTNIIARVVTFDESPQQLLVGEEGNVTLEDNKMNAFRVMVVASNVDQTEGAAYEFKGLIRKNATAASTAILGAITKTVIAESVPAWDAAVSADTANGALKITVTGEADKAIRWVAFIEFVEVAFYSES